MACARHTCPQIIAIYLTLSVLLSSVREVISCEDKFEGFGVFLGSNSHFGRSPPGIEEKVLETVYNSLGIRYFRTSIEEHFSPELHKYEIICTDQDKFTCSWINVHEYVSRLPDAKVFASVWSPPHYMKNEYYQLLPEFETDYFYFLKNVTHLIQRDYNITLETISPVNEPENVFAPWDHTNMSPDQLCRLIRNYNDPIISLCPENSYFWVSKSYYDFDSDDDPSLNCSAYCSVKATHAYALNMNFLSENSLLAYYDLTPYPRDDITAPIWMTEVSSTYNNFVEISKKFFVYKLFVSASNTSRGPVEVNQCGNDTELGKAAKVGKNIRCLQFGEKDKVIVNKKSNAKSLGECDTLCCTTEMDDFRCVNTNAVIPPRSVCHCIKLS